jgi:hypothetical protein
MHASTSRTTYANVVSTLALVIALVGGGAAVAAIAKNSVGSAQIKNSSVKGKDVKPEALTSREIKDTTLTNTLIAAGPRSGSGTLTAPGVKAASVTFMAPSAGLVVVTASAEFSAHAAGTVIGVSLKEGGTTLGGVRDWDPGDNDALFDQTQQATYALPVSAGAHTYDLFLDESTPGAFAEFFGAQLVVQFSARGALG